MTLVERIKNECKKQKISLAALERECGFGNGSIRKWDTSPTSHERLSKVASVLNLSIYDLLEEQEQKKEALSQDEKELSEAEEQMLSLFRQIPADKQSALVDSIEIALRMQGLL